MESETGDMSCDAARPHFLLIIASILALLSHDDDLLLHETLIFKSYDFCNSLSITVVQTVLCMWTVYLYGSVFMMWVLC